MIRQSLVFLLLLIIAIQNGFADELKPAYVELNEGPKNIWQLTWKASERSVLGRYGELLLPDSCIEIKPNEFYRDNGNLVRTSTVNCPQGLIGQGLEIRGLADTSTDALVRVLGLVSQQTLRLTPDRPVAIIVDVPESIIGNVGYAYTVLGIEHILEGYDHLLFVIAIVLLISGWRQIVGAITAFTLAHSVTLIGTTLGYFSLEQRPVEAVIALSIVFMAVELAKRNEGQLRLSESYPWLIAFIFGLLHGFGFAGALSEIGLPKTDVPLALLTFNLGVEIGQLMVVITTLSILMMVRRFLPSKLKQLQLSCAYFIGITSTFWLIERVVA